jgi:hypothetical protein
MTFYWLLMPHIFLLACLLYNKKIGLRPIPIGISLKGILATIESNAFASDFASISNPYQYGIALPEGMQSLQWLFRISCMTCFRELLT